MREKENRSEGESRVIELNKTVKKRGRHRSRKKRTYHVETVLQNDREPTYRYKEESKKKICEMKNEENKVQTDRNEILQICTRFFYTELWSSTLKDQQPSLKNTSPDSSEFPPIITSEVKKNPKEMKNKALGIDSLTNDVVIFGGEEAHKQITHTHTHTN